MCSLSILIPSLHSCSLNLLMVTVISTSHTWKLDVPIRSQNLHLLWKVKKQTFNIVSFLNLWISQLFWISFKVSMLERVISFFFTFFASKRSSQSCVSGIFRITPMLTIGSMEYKDFKERWFDFFLFFNVIH